MNYSKFLREIDRLGYKIDNNYTFIYVDCEGKLTRALYIVEKSTGLGFANVDADRGPNFKAFQELRYYYSNEFKHGKHWIQF